jgi:hypothetical protein
MSERPILGVDKPESQAQQRIPQASEAAVGRLENLALAKELPAWDLVPLDTLLVRRRPTKA